MHQDAPCTSTCTDHIQTLLQLCQQRGVVHSSLNIALVQKHQSFDMSEVRVIPRHHVSRASENCMQMRKGDNLRVCLQYMNLHHSQALEPLKLAGYAKIQRCFQGSDIFSMRFRHFFQPQVLEIVLFVCARRRQAYAAVAGTLTGLHTLKGR